MRLWPVLPLLLLLLLGCDGRVGRIDIWYANRYAPPGGAATVDLGVRPSLRSQILRVEAESEDLGLPPTEILNNEHAPGFGYMITQTKDEKIVTHPVQVPLPAQARPGSAWLTLRVTYRAAEWVNSTQFRTISGQETLRVPVTVVPPGLGWLVRTRDATLPLVWLALVAGACGLLTPRGEQGRWRNVVVILLWIAWIASAWWAFARPLAWALGANAWWSRALLLAGGVYGLFWFMTKVEAFRFRKAPTA